MLHVVKTMLAQVQSAVIALTRTPSGAAVRFVSRDLDSESQEANLHASQRRDCNQCNAVVPQNLAAIIDEHPGCT